MFGLTTVAYGLEQGVLTRNAKKSFLTAQSYPKTFDDLSFTERMAIKAEGYKEWESLYDANGRCIENCAYDGITIEEEEEMSLQATAELQSIIEIEEDAKSENENNTWFSAPVRVPIILTSDFGQRNPPPTRQGRRGTEYHSGIDIKVAEGTPVYAAADGKVVFAGANGGYGNTVEIEHSFSVNSKKAKTLYAHLKEIVVNQNAYVRQGQQIGLSGNTGNSGGPHLHYGLYFNGAAVDPLGANVKPVLILNGQDVSTKAWETKGKNFLGADYCFESGLSSYRLQDFKPGGSKAGRLSEFFPRCTGWCD
jgi:murein DD-endopeptidase MepM/ murein hydrolase activator NlpD